MTAAPTFSKKDGLIARLRLGWHQQHRRHQVVTLLLLPRQLLRVLPRQLLQHLLAPVVAQEMALFLRVMPVVLKRIVFRNRVSYESMVGGSSFLIMFSFLSSYQCDLSILECLVARRTDIDDTDTGRRCATNDQVINSQVNCDAGNTCSFFFSTFLEDTCTGAGEKCTLFEVERCSPETREIGICLD